MTDITQEGLENDRESFTVTFNLNPLRFVPTTTVPREELLGNIASRLVTPTMTLLLNT